MATWPATLPAPAINTLVESPPNNVLRSNMDKGPAKLRRRTTANIRPMSFSMHLTKDQVSTLETFYVTDTFSGVDEFTFVHPRTLATVSARFVQEPQYTEREGILYDVSINLEIMP